MSNNQIEHHLRKALVSNNEASKVTADDTIVLASAMTSVHKTFLILFLLALVAIAVASQARIDIVVSVRGELLLESDVEKVQHLEGGILEEHTDHLEVECKVTDIPEAIVVSVKDIEVGDALHAGDIELPDGVKLISSSEMLLVTCSLVAAAKSTEELEEQVPIAPEVIGEAKETQEESKEAGSVERGA